MLCSVSRLLSSRLSLSVIPLINNLSDLSVSRYIIIQDRVADTTTLIKNVVVVFKLIPSVLIPSTLESIG